MDKKWIPIAAFVFVAMIFAGEILTYSAGISSYDSDAVRNGTSVDYSVASSGTNDYSVILIDNDGFKRLGRLAIYVDEDYDKNIGKASSLSPIRDLNPVYYAEQIQRALKIRSFENVTICNSKGLIDYLNETKDDPKGYGILSLSYALPGEIYTGNSADSLMQWIGQGGSLYWVGSIPGALYYNQGEPTVVQDCQTLFFGVDGCINRQEALIPEAIAGEHTEALCLIDFQLHLGIDTSMLSCQYLSMGITKGGIASTVQVRYGNGMVTQFAGGFEIQQLEDIAQVLASGMCYKSTIVDRIEGKVTRSTVKGSFDSADGDHVFIFIGKNYSVYGRSFDV